MTGPAEPTFRGEYAPGAEEAADTVTFFEDAREVVRRAHTRDARATASRSCSRWRLHKLGERSRRSSASRGAVAWRRRAVGELRGGNCAAEESADPEASSTSGYGRPGARARRLGLLEEKRLDAGGGRRPSSWRWCTRWACWGRRCGSRSSRTTEAGTVCTSFVPDNISGREPGVERRIFDLRRIGTR